MHDVFEELILVELARGVYQSNDRRAKVKNRIDTLTGSDIVEAKSYRGA